MAIQALLAALLPMIQKEGGAAALQVASVAGDIGSSASNTVRHVASGGINTTGAFGGAGAGYVAGGMAKTASSVAGGGLDLANPLSSPMSKLQSFVEVGTAIATLPAQIRDWGLALKDSQRALKDYSGAMAEIFAYSEYRDLLRQRKTAQETAGTTGFMVGSIDDLQDTLQPISVDIRNIANFVVGKMAQGMDVLTTMATALVAKLAPDLASEVGEILKALRGAGSGTGRPPVASFVDYIMKTGEGRGLGSDIPLERGYERSSGGLPEADKALEKFIMSRRAVGWIWGIIKPYLKTRGAEPFDAFDALRGAMRGGDAAERDAGAAAQGAGGGGLMALGYSKLRAIDLAATPADGPFGDPEYRGTYRFPKGKGKHRTPFWYDLPTAKFRTEEDEADIASESGEPAYEEMLRRRGLGRHHLAAERRRARRARLGRDETGRRIDITPDRVAESVDWSRAAAIRERARLARVPRVSPK